MNDVFLDSIQTVVGGKQWRRWLSHCTTSRKVAGSIPDGVTGIFHWHNPSGHTVALGLTQPLTGMSTRNISWGVKAAGAWGWQSYRLHVPIVLKSGSLNLLEPSGPVQACNGIALSFIQSVVTAWWVCKPMRQKWWLTALNWGMVTQLG